MGSNINLNKTNPYYILCNKLASRGLKASSYGRCLFVLEKLKIRVKKSNESVLNLIFALLEVYVYIYKKKVGGNVHSIPFYLNENVRLKRGLSNFLKVIYNKKEKTYKERILNEMVDITNTKGSTMILRNNIYMTASEEKSNLRFIKPRTKRPPLNYKKLIKR